MANNSASVRPTESFQIPGRSYLRKQERLAHDYRHAIKSVAILIDRPDAFLVFVNNFVPGIWNILLGRTEADYSPSRPKTWDPGDNHVSCFNSYCTNRLLAKSAVAKMLGVERRHRANPANRGWAVGGMQFKK